ncbi:MAG TPA: Uma2 family endonuclease, partial [Longimicrobiales bacterium]|nr:Uma2 family endonuclease [Longimicrobiales bacterium]
MMPIRPPGVARRDRRFATRPPTIRRVVVVPPKLIVEVVSPMSASIDRVKKPRRYGEFGVPEYWAVDPHLKAVDVWRFRAGRT